MLSAPEKSCTRVLLSHISYGVHVVGEPAHQVSAAAGIIKPHRQPLHPGKQVAPDPQEGILGHVQHDPGLEIAGGHTGHVYGRHDRQSPCQTRNAPCASVRRSDKLVDDGPQHVSAGQGCYSTDEDAEKCQPHFQPVLLQISHKPL